MSKKRAVAKYGIAGVLTALYGLSVVKLKTDPPKDGRSTWQRQAGVASVITAATWLVAYL